MDVLSQIIMANLPAVLCLVVGFVLVVIEMYIPGFGVPGITGIILLIVGIAWRANNPVEALVMTVVIVALLCVALSISIHSASKGRLSKSKLILHEVSNSPIDENDLDYFVGRDGHSRTVLRPAGIGEFDGVRLNVVSDGEFITKDAPIRVKRVEGNRIVVAPISEKEIRDPEEQPQGQI